MDVVLVCNVSNLCKALSDIYTTSMYMSKFDLNVKVDYVRSRIMINILGDGQHPPIIKRCHIENVVETIQKIESDYM